MADSLTQAAPLALELRGIEKRFGPTHANRDVTLTVGWGSVHGVVGENGAGKSTLMKIASGLLAPDAGEVRVGGRVGMVHQHFMLVDDFTVLENVLLGFEGGFQLARPLARARAELAELSRTYGLEFPLDARVGELPVGVRQRIEIAKALFRRADLLILDEPTAVLTPRETDQLFELVRRLRTEGKSVILVTHKLREVMDVTDRVTVMRQGAVVAESATAETSIRALAEVMIGRPPAPPVRQPRPAGPVVLSAHDLVIRDRAGVPRVNGVSLELRGGEIVGIAGVSGNGQTELVEALAGLRPVDSGRLVLPRGRIAHVPEDRLRSGLVPEFSAAENSILGYQDAPEFNRGIFLDRGAVAAACAGRMEAFDVRPRLPALEAASFSGGNQQKLIIARELAASPAVLLANQPTRGVDIGAIEFIHGQLLAMRERGGAVLLVSVELDEILALSDRVLAMSAGAIVGELAKGEATQEKLGLLMAGIGPPPGGAP